MSLSAVEMERKWGKGSYETFQHIKANLPFYQLEMMDDYAKSVLAQFAVSTKDGTPVEKSEVRKLLPREYPYTDGWCPTIKWEIEVLPNPKERVVVQISRGNSDYNMFSNCGPYFY